MNAGGTHPGLSARPPRISIWNSSRVGVRPHVGEPGTVDFDKAALHRRKRRSTSESRRVGLSVGVLRGAGVSNTCPAACVSTDLAPQPPTASFTHFVVKLVFAAPPNFFSAAALSQDVAASVSHFFIKLFIAAPASFLFPASILHDSAKAALETSTSEAVRRSNFIAIFPG